jgi:hypothetical protein
MTNQFIKPIKEFLEITKNNLGWVASEIQHQYFLSTLRDIEKKYPEMHTEVEAFTEHLDAIFYGITDEDCPDFVEAPEDDFGLPNTYERTNIESDFAIDDSAFETEAETDAFKFVEMKQNISEDGLNEPRYPYDTEPSA